MIRRITIDELMRMPDRIPFADVRTPAEFLQGHMPGAYNLPLFSNEERVLVGTTYKQTGREAALLLGFDLAGPKWSGFIRQALKIAPQRRIAVHCWRGGMRSGAMAWALDLYGFEVLLLEGGYKSYRRWVFRQFKEAYRLWVVGGMTGSGKTAVLRQLRLLGEQVIDLEDLAQHQGSAYGTLTRLVQPTQEQFENNLAEGLSRLDRNRKTWVEDESLMIGKCLVPKPFWNLIQTEFLIDLQVPEEKRIEGLVKEYGSLDKAFLEECTERIGKRLGTERTKHAVTAIREGRMDEFIRQVLVYYDKTYRTAMGGRKESRVFTVVLKDTDAVANALHVQEFVRE